MIGAGTVINPIIKIVTTVVILGAVYLFFVKPALDTTEDITDAAFESSNSIQQQIQEDLRKSFQDVPNFNVPQVSGLPQSSKQLEKLGDCVTAASGDIDRVTRCMERFAQ